MKRIVLFASGSGSNVENIARYFKGHPQVSISCVLTNKRNAYVIDRCNALNISILYFNKHSFYSSSLVLDVLKCIDPDVIVLAGFLWKIPEVLVQEFPNRIINVHPALLPKYGGKGMYGAHVHKAVLENKEKETWMEWISKESRDLILRRREAMYVEDEDLARELKRIIRKNLREDKRKWEDELTKKELGVKEQRQGLRHMGQPCKPKRYARRDRNGRLVNMNMRAVGTI